MIDRLPSTVVPSLILVVDDELEDIQVVSSLLEGHGHVIITAQSGPEALTKLESIKPDLILLDVMMPGMTGFELCRILQANPETCDTPIIFLTGLDDRNYVLDALQSGGVDYVTKPFHDAELLTRVDLHSRLRKSRRYLADLILEKNRLLEVVAHDLKNPLNGIQFAAIMLREKSGSPDSKGDVLLDSIIDSATRAFEIISTLLEVRGLDEVKSNIKKQPVCLNEVAIKALKGFEQHVRSKKISLDFTPQSAPVMVLAETQTLLCCLENLISNAIKFSNGGKRICVQVSLDGESGMFVIADEGPGINSDEIEHLFKKFTRLSARPTNGEASTGLGLHIVHELATAMQGSVHYGKSSLGGACFTLKFPLAPAA